MTKEKFDEIYKAAYKETFKDGKDDILAHFEAHLEKAADENGQLSNRDLATCVYFESIAANVAFTRSVLEKLLVE